MKAVRFHCSTFLILLCVVFHFTVVHAQDEKQVERDVVRLLKKLKQQQDNRQAGQDDWALTIKELIELGPDAVPALSDALIKTPMEDRRMLRSIPFVLRGIGDKRAVPALIQTLPRCNHGDGSDMGYNTEDPELLAFMRKHDDDLKDRDPTGYNWGRPINEVRTALNKLTGTEHGEIELCHIHGDRGNPRQRHLKHELFMRCADRWAVWWEENWRDHISDERFSKVELPDFSTDDSQFRLPRDTSLSVASRRGNMMAEPVFTKKKDARVFYDIDTGRWGAVHKRWRGAVTMENEPIVRKWAISEGYDLMGHEVTVDGKQIWVLECLGADAWELPFDYWTGYKPSTANQIIAKGRKVSGTLICLGEDDKPDYRATGLFLVITRHDTPAFVRLGIEVHDDTMKIGVITRGDDELNPVAFRKGRRFALRLLEERQ